MCCDAGTSKIAFVLRCVLSQQHHASPDTRLGGSQEY